VLGLSMLVLSFVKGRANLSQFLDSHPVEVLAARDYLRSVNARGQRVVARKPHLPYFTHNEWVFFPQVDSIEELRAWLDENPVDYLAISRRELKERKELKPLGDPDKAPDWLRAAWVSEEPLFILYQPRLAP
jgi:hypothetical protein